MRSAEPYFVIEIDMPDGVHWFGGIVGKKQVGPDGKQIETTYNMWTPYFDEAISEPEDKMNGTLPLLGVEGAKVVPVLKSRHAESASLQYCGFDPIVCRNCPPSELKVGDFARKTYVSSFFQVTEVTDKLVKGICVKKGEEIMFSAKGKHNCYVVRDQASINLLTKIKKK